MRSWENTRELDFEWGLDHYNTQAPSPNGQIQCRQILVFKKNISLKCIFWEEYPLTCQYWQEIIFLTDKRYNRYKIQTQASCVMGLQIPRDTEKLWSLWHEGFSLFYRWAIILARGGHRCEFKTRMGCSSSCNLLLRSTFSFALQNKCKTLMRATVGDENTPPMV